MQNEILKYQAVDMRRLNSKFETIFSLYLSANSIYIPNTYLLVLAGQMVSTSIIVASHYTRGCAWKVLGASCWCLATRVAIILKQKWNSYCKPTDILSINFSTYTWVALILHERVANPVTPAGFVPNWKFSSLQASLASTYICSPVFVPHNTGLLPPPGLVTENESVRHWDARDAKTVDVGLTAPVVYTISTDGQCCRGNKEFLILSVHFCIIPALFEDVQYFLNLIVVWKWLLIAHV